MLDGITFTVETALQLHDGSSESRKLVFSIDTEQRARALVQALEMLRTSDQITSGNASSSVSTVIATMQQD